MSITYIGHSLAKEEKSEKLRHFLESIVMPAVKSSDGCESCELFQNHDDPNSFVMIEVWSSIEAHQASIKNIPPGSIDEFMKLVAELPEGNHYRRLHSL